MSLLGILFRNYPSYSFHLNPGQCSNVQMGIISCSKSRLCNHALIYNEHKLLSFAQAFYHTINGVAQVYNTNRFIVGHVLDPDSYPFTL